MDVKLFQKTGYLSFGYETLRIVNGVFYDRNWQEVYVPLTKAEYERIVRTVYQEERRLNRRLRKAELDRLL